MEQPLTVIMITEKSICYKTWVNRGILKECNLLDTQGQFLAFEDFKHKFGVCCTFFNYAVFLRQLLNLGRACKILGNSWTRDTVNWVNPSSLLPIATPSSLQKKACLILTEQSFFLPLWKSIYWYVNKCQMSRTSANFLLKSPLKTS